MSFLEKEIQKYRWLFYIKLGSLITLIFVSLLFIVLLFPSGDEFFGPKVDILSWFLIGLLSSFTLILTSTFIILSLNQYRDYLRRKSTVIQVNRRLTFEDIFENENRKNIINKILQTPGIHNNELLRQCNLQKGQLSWHLSVLLQYGIIKKEKLGQYTTFFPVFSTKRMRQIPSKLIMKSNTGNKILNLIERNPGINSANIAKKLNIRRNSVKYHVDKLIKLELLILEKHNREIKLFINQKFYYN